MTSQKPWIAVGVLCVTLGACDDKKHVGAPSATAQGAASPSTATSKSKSKFPPEARRNSAPRGIAERALAVGSMAPVLQNLPSTTGVWNRGERVTALVFYRGHW